MDMKISRRDAALLIGLAGVLIAAATYYFVYMPLGDKQRALETENATLQQRVDGLQQMADNKTFYEEETARMTADNEALMSQFPADVREEDMVMLAVTLQNNAPWEAVSMINITPATEQYVLGQKQAEAAAEAAAAAQAATTTTDGTTAADTTTTAPAAATPATDTTIASPGTDTVTKVLYKTKAGITYQSDYAGFKNGMNAIAAQGNRETIDQVAAVYDIETGILGSTVDVNMYYLTGTDKVYEKPQIPPMQQGTENIFGTVSLVGSPVEDESEAGTEE